MNLVNPGNPILRAVIRPVKPDRDVSEIVDGMFKLMRMYQGVGLAAPQVGLDERIIIIEYGAVSAAILNPVITKAPGKIVTSLKEGCLSYPGKRVNVKRHKRVIVEGFDIDWKPIKIDARNFLAFIMQHEIDHLNGKTIG